MIAALGIRWWTITALTLILTEGVAFAAHTKASRVVVVRAEHESRIAHEATLRLQAELETTGFEVVTVDSKRGMVPRDNVEDESFGGVASLSIVNTGERAVIDVWISDHLTKKTTVQRVDVRLSDEATTPALLAVRAVELLRASLLEVEGRAEVPSDVLHFVQPRSGLNPALEGPPPVAVAPPSPAAPSAQLSDARSPTTSPPPIFLTPIVMQARPHEPSHPISIGLGMSTLYHFDREAPSFSPIVSAAWSLVPRWSVGAELAAPSWGVPRRRAGGSVALTETWAITDVSFAMLASGVVIPRLTTGFGVHRAWIEGSANAPDHSHSAETTSFVLALEPTVDFEVSSHFSIDLEGRLLFAIPRVRLLIDGVDAGGVSTLNLGASAGLRYTP